MHAPSHTPAPTTPSRCHRCGRDTPSDARFCARCGTHIDAREPPIPGRRIAPNFELLSRIGRGSMGIVYRARQRSLDKIVAVKVLRPEFVSDATILKRFRREALAASRLHSPHIVRVIDFGLTREGAPFIAMEFIEGCDLGALLDRDAPLSHERIIDLSAQILLGLEDAHHAGVIHRDLKPANILVSELHNREHARILDFGIAKLTAAARPRSGGGVTRLTRDGLVCGTPAFMSPEQVAGAPLDHRSDLFSFGVILYQLLTDGHLPFRGKTPTEMASSILLDDPIPPSELRPDTPRALERICMRCLAKAPENRFIGAKSLRRELLAARETDTSRASRARRSRSDAPSRKPAKRTRRRRRRPRERSRESGGTLLPLVIGTLIGLAALALFGPG